MLLVLKVSLAQEPSHTEVVQVLSNAHYIHDSEQVLTFQPRMKITEYPLYTPKPDGIYSLLLQATKPHVLYLIL